MSGSDDGAGGAGPTPGRPTRPVPAPRGPSDRAAAAPATWARLAAGNARWAAGGSDAGPARSPRSWTRLVHAQSPVAAVLACSDSRVPVELVLDQGPGDLFVVRTAGHALDTTVLASLDYAVSQLHVPLLVVMGHHGCGALAAATAVLEGAPAPGGHLGDLVAALVPAVDRARLDGMSHPHQVSAHHAASTADLLLRRSPVIHAAHDSGTTDVVAITYALADGRTTPARACAPGGDLGAPVLPARSRAQGRGEGRRWRPGEVWGGGAHRS
ncbi:carbonic anhydrase [uncultured Pseudokineococcus sp.]|uniref:carbonic anhydrase n=1 Tax=uncultured Pseudokineococcus sp. TaxID=1642928 RepID=UPI0026276A96|nr:carbonic anhydrase [uncultured Pseudokineococcus sp.]